MEELMDMGYARKCDGKGQDGKTWYVPHQGVLNHDKGKILLFLIAVRNKEEPQ